MKPAPSSFRDPAGRVFEADGRILRSVSESAARELRFVRESGALNAALEEGRVVAATATDPRALGEHALPNGAALEHPRLPFISYPYEWPFALLRAAALHHLDLHCEVLAHGVTLSDASAYNIQWDGARPVFIDWLSFRRYRAGEYWAAHRQFCEQFLNPLLLGAELGVPHNAWYRGAQEGISAEDLARVLPWRRRWFSWRLQTHVFLPLRLAARAGADTQKVLKRVRARGLPAPAFRALLVQLRHWIAALEEPAQKTPWRAYHSTTSYSAPEAEAKRALVREFASTERPELLFDVGCNTGEWSETALAAGARYAVGLDADAGALAAAAARAQAPAAADGDHAVHHNATLRRARAQAPAATAGGDHAVHHNATPRRARADANKLRFLPLFQDAANPTPAQGFASRERASLVERAAPARDGAALLALALIHHLVIARNLPLAGVLDWLIELAPRGLIEFVPKDDPRVQGLLALREDIFPHYNAQHFEALLRARARVRRVTTVSARGRRIYWYDTR